MYPYAIRFLIPGKVFDFPVICFYAYLFDPFVYIYMPFIQVFVEACVPTRKIGALEAKIDIFFFTAYPYIAVFEQFAFLCSTAVARGSCEVGEKDFKIGIFRKYGFIEQFCKPGCIYVEVAQRLF